MRPRGVHLLLPQTLNYPVLNLQPSTPGMVPITRNKGATLKEMGAAAISEAMADAGVDPKRVGALYVGNMMSGMLSDQQHLGPYIATAAGLAGVEATTIEACCGGGGAALRMGYMAVASGMHETVVVAGVEQMTHQDRDMARVPSPPSLE